MNTLAKNYKTFTFDMFMHRSVKNKTLSTLFLMIFLGILTTKAQINPRGKIIDKTPLSIDKAKLNRKPIVQLKTIKSGLGGIVFDSKTDKKLAKVTIVFTSEDKKLVKKVTTNFSGGYKITLPPGRYYYTIKHKGYQSLINEGFVVVIFGTYGTSNYFLTPKFTKGNHPVFISVFDKKTKRIVDILEATNENK